MLVAYLRVRNFRFTHVANETSTANKWIGVRNKQNGVSPGFPDFLIIVSNHLCFIELKRQKKSWPTAEQLVWIESLNACGIAGQICKGYEAAKDFIEGMEKKYEKNK